MLGETNVDVKPLAFDLAKPTVPADAAVVVVADPRGTFRPAEAEALRAYLSAPQAGGKKGKLVVLSSPSPAPGGAGGVADTGLEPVLAEYGMTLDNRYVLGAQSNSLGFSDIVVDATPDAFQANLSLVNSLEDRGTVFANCRLVRVGAPVDSAVRVVPVLVNRPGRATWLEPDRPADPGQAFQNLLADKTGELIRARQASNGARVVAAAAVDGTAGRVVVFGSGDAFRDSPRRGGPGANATLLAATVNYLRDRPAAADIPAKTHGVYRPSPDPDWVKLVLLPALIGAFATVALGVGVFMLRRR